MESIHALVSRSDSTGSSSTSITSRYSRTS
jgi:hypothetical protein